jgi:multidrug efflux pump
VLTLITTPVIYVCLDGLANRRRRRNTAPRAAPGAALRELPA